jgi:hypothetical protein
MSSAVCCGTKGALSKESALSSGGTPQWLLQSTLRHQRPKALWAPVEKSKKDLILEEIRLSALLLTFAAGAVAIDSNWDGFVHFKNWKGCVPNNDRLWLAS